MRRPFARNVRGSESAHGASGRAFRPDPAVGPLLLFRLREGAARIRQCAAFRAWFKEEAAASTGVSGRRAQPIRGRRRDRLRRAELRERQVAQQFVAGETLHGLPKRHDICRHAGVAAPTMRLVVRPGISCPTFLQKDQRSMWPSRRSINFSRIIDEQMDDPRGTAISTLTLSQAARYGRSRGPAPSDLTEASSPRRLSGAACPRSA